MLPMQPYGGPIGIPSGRAGGAASKGNAIETYGHHVWNLQRVHQVARRQTPWDTQYTHAQQSTRSAHPLETAAAQHVALA
jgi:hypothetical protein